MVLPSIPNPSAETTNLFPKIDYSAKDFPLTKQALIEFVKARFPDDFTDFTESNLSVMLLELCSWVGDLLSFTVDLAANECYLPTIRQIQNAVNMVKLIDYQPNPPSSASVEVKIDTLSPTGFPDDATIPEGTQITVSDLTFELLSDYVLPATTPDAGPGSTSGLPGPTFAEGQSLVDNIVAPNSDPGQFYVTENNPVIRNSIEVRVNAALWDEVSALVFSGASDVYEVSFDGDNFATIRFGNGISGNIPLVGSTIDIYYRVGGGAQGNIAANTISTQVTANTIGGPVQITVTNPNPASGGADQESLGSIKFNAPRALKTVGNAVSKEDYDFFVSTYTDPLLGSIAKGIAFPRFGQTNSSANEVDIWVWTRTAGGDLVAGASQALKESLLDFLNIRKVINVDLFINDGLLKSIDIDVILYIDQRIKESDDILTDVNQAIDDFFNRDSLEPAQSFFVSELYKVIMNQAGVQQCNIIEPGTTVTTSDTVLSSFVSGLTTDVTATTGGLTPNEYAGGSITFTSGALSGKKYPVLKHTASVITVDAIITTLAPTDGFDLVSLGQQKTDVPTADNEIYVLGNFTLAAYERNQDTRESILVGNL